MIEAKVVEYARTYLRDAGAVSSAASQSNLNGAFLRGLISAANDAARNWASERLLSEIVAEIHIQSDLISIGLKLDGFLCGDAKQADQTVTIKLELPVQIKRRGIEMRLVMEPSDQHRNDPDQSLIAAIAKGHVWFEDWLHGRIKNYKELVASEGVSASYIGDVMKLAFLSPKIVEDIVQGRQPEGLMVSHLTRVDEVPSRWKDQVHQYGWR